MMTWKLSPGVFESVARGWGSRRQVLLLSCDGAAIEGPHFENHCHQGVFKVSQVFSPGT